MASFIGERINVETIFTAAVFLLFPILSSAIPNNHSFAFSITNRGLDPSTVTATVLSESSPISSTLFGNIGPAVGSQSEFNAYVHPRIITGDIEWNQLLQRYADDTYFDVSGSWSRYHRVYTLAKGPTSSFISDLVALDGDGTTALYTGDVENLSVLTEAQLTAIKPLVDSASLINELASGSFFMCAFWASVSQKRADMFGESARFLPTNITQTCIKATVVWSKVMLAHRAYYCNPVCPTSSTGKGNLWNYNKKWEVSNDWYTASSGLALSYDVLFHDMAPGQKKVVRSALALLVMKRWSWGNSISSDRNSPNAVIHPHRIFSNWAMYHSNLYLANLAIEKETGFDVYTSAVLNTEGETGFNAGLNTRFTAMIEAYLAHSIYGDGSTFEDGYTYFIALREGSLGLVAAHRRGAATIDTPRFRNLIHNAVQMYEPWKCGDIIGHSSGGGLGYPAHVGLFRYAYPNGALPTMLWKQRMTPTFQNHMPCRIEWYQNMVQLTFLGDEHVSNAHSMQGMDEVEKQLIPKSFYSPRRGLLIARGSHEEDAVLVHFDARPDCFFPGHDNADRGVITFSAYKKTWLVDLWWRQNVDSRKHSLMHVDGLAQDEKAPCAHMMKVLDDGAVVLASADLTYAYNVQWARNWPYNSPPTQYVVTYNNNGTSQNVYTIFSTKETGHPWDFGWPAGDDGADIGMTRLAAKMNGDPDMGFRGMWTWKRDYRTTQLAWAVRSTALVRSEGALGYFLLADSFEMTGTAGTHKFESYMIIADDAVVNDSTSFCSGNSCLINIKAPGVNAQLDIHVITLGSSVSYRSEIFDGHKRVVIKSENMQGEEFFIAFNAHNGDPNGFAMTRLNSGELQVSYNLENRFFRIADGSHDLVIADNPTQANYPTNAALPASSPSASSISTTYPSDQLIPPNVVIAPMTPVLMEFRKVYNIRRKDVNMVSAEYLHPTNARFQMVFKFISKSPMNRLTRADRFHTCFSKWTNTRTDFAVYDCGDAGVADVNYIARACSLVAQSASTDVCNSIRSDLRRRFTKNKPYFLAMSIPAGVRRPKVWIKHSVGSYPSP